MRSSEMLSTARHGVRERERLGGAQEEDISIEIEPCAHTAL